MGIRKATPWIRVVREGNGIFRDTRRKVVREGSIPRTRTSVFDRERAQFHTPISILFAFAFVHSGTTGRIYRLLSFNNLKGELEEI